MATQIKPSIKTTETDNFDQKNMFSHLPQVDEKEDSDSDEIPQI